MEISSASPSLGRTVARRSPDGHRLEIFEVDPGPRAHITRVSVLWTPELVQTLRLALDAYSMEEQEAAEGMPDSIAETPIEQVANLLRATGFDIKRIVPGN